MQWKTLTGHSPLLHAIIWSLIFPSKLKQISVDVTAPSNHLPQRMAVPGLLLHVRLVHVYCLNILKCYPKMNGKWMRQQGERQSQRTDFNGVDPKRLRTTPIRFHLPPAALIKWREVSRKRRVGSDSTLRICASWKNFMFTRNESWLIAFLLRMIDGQELEVRWGEVIDTNIVLNEGRLRHERGRSI